VIILLDINHLELTFRPTKLLLEDPINVYPTYRLEDKLTLLKALYEYLDSVLPKDELFCKPTCSACCTTKLYATSLEAYYLLPTVPQKLLEEFRGKSYPRPKLTHNELLRLYRLGGTPPEEEITALLPCPFLTEENLCSVYDRRPLMCRIMVSTVNCQEKGFAEPPEFHYTAGLLLLQVVENIDLGGLYGSLFDLLLFWKDLEEGRLEEVPPYLLSNIEEEEYPILPHEKDYQRFLGGLYRKELPSGPTFRELWVELKEGFSDYSALSFLREIAE
jgi:Fe-S-cluster containining protein